jgi:hypothetical protein
MFDNSNNTNNTINNGLNQTLMPQQQQQQTQYDYTTSYSSSSSLSQNDLYQRQLHYQHNNRFTPNRQAQLTASYQNYGPYPQAQQLRPQSTWQGNNSDYISYDQQNYYQSHNNLPYNHHQQQHYNQTQQQQHTKLPTNRLQTNNKFGLASFTSNNISATNQSTLYYTSQQPSSTQHQQQSQSQQQQQQSQFLNYQNKRPCSSIGSSPLSVASSLGNSPHSNIDSELGSPAMSNVNNNNLLHNTIDFSVDYYNLDLLLQQLNLYDLRELPDLCKLIPNLIDYLQTM